MPSTATGNELVSRRTRRAFRELATDTVLREIDGMWEDEGFAPGPPNDESGQRRNLYQSYLDGVDWTDASQVSRAYGCLRRLLMGSTSSTPREPSTTWLGDGYRIDANGSIVGGPVALLREESLANLSDPAAIRDHLDRISRAIEGGDPAQAVGSAKELIESTAKVVLQELKQPVDPKDDVPQLVSKAQRALGVHPSSVGSGPDTSDAVKKILGGATTITTGLAELRNRGYGTGHGPAGPRVGLGPRHAHFAVAGARLCASSSSTPWPTLGRRGPRLRMVSLNDGSTLDEGLLVD